MKKKEADEAGDEYVMETMSDADPAIPCGLIAKSFFNDEYKIVKLDVEGNEIEIPINETDIAWGSDITYRFNNTLKEDTDRILDANGDPENLSWKDI